MKLSNVGETTLHFSEEEAREAMLACGFAESSLESMEILAVRDPRGGVVEVVVYADVGTWAGNNADGWNDVNSLQEIGDLDASDINTMFGEGAAELSIWAAYLARKSEE